MSPTHSSTLDAAAQQSHHNTEFALQKYLLLQEQHESLLSHLDQIRPVSQGSTTTSTSPSTSPSRRSSIVVASSNCCRHHTRSSSLNAPRTTHHTPPSRRSSIPAYTHSALATVPDEATLCEVASEEEKLVLVNEGIKRALTELLNCDAVRADVALRTWVQGRLMETERELRTGRRRRSGVGCLGGEH